MIFVGWRADNSIWLKWTIWTLNTLFYLQCNCTLSFIYDPRQYDVTRFKRLPISLLRLDFQLYNAWTYSDQGDKVYTKLLVFTKGKMTSKTCHRTWNMVVPKYWFFLWTSLIKGRPRTGFWMWFETKDLYPLIRYEFPSCVKWTFIRRRE